MKIATSRYEELDAPLLTTNSTKIPNCVKRELVFALWRLHCVLLWNRMRCYKAVVQ